VTLTRARKWYAADNVLRRTGNVRGHAFTVHGNHYLGEEARNDGRAQEDPTQPELHHTARSSGSDRVPETPSVQKFNTSVMAEAQTSRKLRSTGSICFCWFQMSSVL
jgi:hypothetical protein